ncbi:Anthranilate 1,2-dioxygenase ferredoxin subunit [compost metagenome]
MDTWKPVALVADISPDTGTLRVVHEGEGVCLYKLPDDICATQDRCPHGNASLADGYLEDGTIECPLHQGVFDIRTGKPQCPPVTTDLRRYEVRVEADTIYLKAEAA